MSKFYNKTISPACKYCVHSNILAYSDDTICKYKGVTESDFSCKNYKYDPLKRIPNLPKSQNNYSKSDFEL